MDSGKIINLPRPLYLYGRLAFVTGAGSYIGKIICQALAHDGAMVIAADNNFKAAKETVDFLKGHHKHNLLKGPHYPLFVNVTNRRSIVTGFKYVTEIYKKPPSIVVNAVDFLRSDPIITLSEKKFDDVMEVNLKGTFLVMQVAANAMMQVADNDDNDFSIINVGSIFGKLGCDENSNYSASKAGVIALTKSAAIEFARLKYKIRVNAVLPGVIHTPMQKNNYFKEMCNERVTLYRKGYPDELANVIRFLAASSRSSYIHGACIEVTGGLH